MTGFPLLTADGRAKPPERIRLEGRYVTLVPLDAGEHAEPLWEATCGPANDALWRYLADGPFAARIDFDRYLETKARSQDPLFYAVLNRESGRATGHAALMRVEVTHRVIEVGNILYSPLLQRTRGGTEAIYLLAKYVFDGLGYRRLEWKCNALNEASRNAALRFGFTFEGVFRQHMIVKGRNSDTAWFSMLDSEWPSRKQEFERWLAPSNFDPEGRQKTSLRR